MAQGLTPKGPSCQNQPPRSKTVAYRPQTDRQTYTDSRQTEKVKTEGPLLIFLGFFFAFYLRKWSDMFMMRGHWLEQSSGVR